jgi:ferredoxin-nitrate reductase
MFKSGAVSVTKAPTTASSHTAPVSIPEQQSTAVSSVETSKPNAIEIKSTARLQRHLPFWLNSTAESITVLIDIFTRILPILIKDKEIHAGILTLRTIATEMSNTLSPNVSKYGSGAIAKAYGHHVSASLRDMLFPASRQQHLGSYETLSALQALKMYYSHVEGHFIALGPASQALWDREFIDAVSFCKDQLSRLVAWADFHLKVKSPQILLVPDKQFLEDDVEEGEGEV